jgi:hypothetical protein
MSDIADDANEQMELLHSIELAVRKPEGPAATGVCLHCGEVVSGRWCDRTCRDSWEYERSRHGNSI